MTYQATYQGTRAEPTAAYLDSIIPLVCSTSLEREQFDWAAYGLLDFLATEDDAWLPAPDGYADRPPHWIARQELRHRLGEMLPGMVDELGPDEQAKGRASVKAARRILDRLR